MLKFKPFSVNEFKEYSEKYDLEFNKNKTITQAPNKSLDINYYYFNVRKELKHKCDLCNKKETITKILIRVDRQKSFLAVNGIRRECANCEFIKNLKDEAKNNE